ncbi:unnamed protein product [Pleuronectes platessa]|uniref:Uncharacterized protein n=1 Tax=Pleuronectes platessa TaxID=8262 RepID=A0A9N7VFL7_PLEPL|nr:unnamed protein product [Pleuronectes platessa]
MAYCNKGAANEGQGTDCSDSAPTPLHIHKALLHNAPLGGFEGYQPYNRLSVEKSLDTYRQMPLPIRHSAGDSFTPRQLLAENAEKETNVFLMTARPHPVK